MIDPPDPAEPVGLTGLGPALDRLTSELPDAPAITCLDVTLSRAELSSRSNRMARRLAALGVGRGSTVTIALANGVAFYETTIAIWKLGAVPQPISYRLPAPELSALIDLADPALVLGGHIVVMERFDAARCLALVEQFGVTFIYLVPTMMSRILRLPEQERLSRNMASLRTAYHLAAPCPAHVKRAWIDWLGPDVVVELYAGTEAQAATRIDGSEWLAHPGSVGRVVMGEMKVLSPEGLEQPPGEVGEIWMRPGTARPTYHYVGASARQRDGWESLGDMGRFDDDGYLYLSDRRADMILVGGANVYPAEVEAALDEHPAVMSSCVVGLPDEDLGNVVHTIVETRDQISDDELRRHLTARLVSYKLPRTFERSAEPLRDDAGKVRRSALREARLPVAEQRSSGA